ncbi:orotidine 5'-phosphate decarboxylase [Boudabousia tangfeifanii]|uniref:Orotidine 5'-phosphate decarboxylase n=1 Tax=Boudabousia tangfeifanii TaxID=1912795 RepID=A0A1D9MJZ3_9ACTO|nr:orotidine-5'-phosphate decarboxylase [Boudabousia tangfeifanii]AOZ72624.1 orotidine 5'-phosphate decarboxylase [Boudabousia tangfeifanii]
MSTENDLSQSFGARLATKMREAGPVCVGIDPHPNLLAAWDLPDSAQGLEKFGMTVLEAVGEQAAAFKPQSAFFERHGAKGVAALETILQEAKSAGFLTILDVKRGDIGSTMSAYAESFLTPGAPSEADAITLSPYLGLGSLAPAHELAVKHGKGLFVLALTSNPEGASVQHSQNAQGQAVARMIAEGVAQWNQPAREAGLMGSFGLVVGATIGSAAQDLGLDLGAVNGPMLAPGVGAQGAGGAELSQVFGHDLSLVLASSSRGILKGGPTLAGLQAAFADTLAEVKQAVGC